jgi:hypothetical protein
MTDKEKIELLRQALSDLLLTAQFLSDAGGSGGGWKSDDFRSRLDKAERALTLTVA